MRFRPYQVDLFTQMCARLCRHIFLNGGVSIGKTVLTQAFISHCFDHGIFTHALISSPYGTIRGGFATDDQHLTDYKRELLIGDGIRIMLRPDLIRSLEEDTVRVLSEYLANPRPLDNGLPYAYTVCRQTTLSLARVLDQLPQDLRTYLFVFDEAQETGAVTTKHFLDMIKSRGAHTLLLSGSPYREDNVGVLPLEGAPDTLILSRSLAEQIRDGFAPEISLNLIPVNCDAPTFEGRMEQMIRCVANNTLPHQKRIIRSAPNAGVWQESINEERSEDQDKTAGNRMRELAREIIEDSSEVATVLGHSPRFIDATTYPDCDPDESWLDDERKVQEYSASNVDIVWGINRVYAGLDWPLANTVECLDLPTTLTLVVQLLGRAMRSKRIIEGYPEVYRDRSVFNVYVPTLQGNEQYLRSDAAQLAVKLSAVFAQVTLPHGLSACLELHRHLRSQLSDATPLGSAVDCREDVLARVLEDASIVTYNEQQVMVGDLRRTLLNQGLHPDAVNVQITRLISERNERDPVYQREQLENTRRVAERVAEDSRNGVIPPWRLMQHAYQLLVDEYEETRINVRESTLLNAITTYTTPLNHHTARYIQERLVALRQPLFPGTVCQWAIRYFRDHHVYPDNPSQASFVEQGGTVEGTQIRWGDVIRALQTGRRGLPAHPTIQDFVRQRSIGDEATLDILESIEWLSPTDWPAEWPSLADLYDYHVLYTALLHSAGFSGLNREDWRKIVDYLVSQTDIGLGRLLHEFRTQRVESSLNNSRHRPRWRAFWANWGRQAMIENRPVFCSELHRQVLETSRP